MATGLTVTAMKKELLMFSWHLSLPVWVLVAAVMAIVIGVVLCLGVIMFFRTRGTPKTEWDMSLHAVYEVVGSYTDPKTKLHFAFVRWPDESIRFVKTQNRMACGYYKLGPSTVTEGPRRAMIPFSTDPEFTSLSGQPALA
jgi:hypothetical protein